MSVRYGEDFAYAHEKLNGSVVKYNGLPVMVEQVRKDGEVLYSPLGHGQIMSLCTLKELDLTPFRLGYINLTGHATYCFRQPVRVWKQGLREACLIGVTNNAREHISFDTRFLDMLMGFYPPIESCIEWVFNGEMVSRSFHKNFSITSTKSKGGNLSLGYKDRVVGSVTLEGVVNLHTPFKFLEETLMEVLK